jgi:hypothetical protein
VPNRECRRLSRFWTQPAIVRRAYEFRAALVRPSAPNPHGFGAANRTKAARTRTKSGASCEARANFGRARTITARRSAEARTSHQIIRTQTYELTIRSRNAGHSCAPAQGFHTSSDGRTKKRKKKCASAGAGSSGACRRARPGWALGRCRRLWRGGLRQMPSAAGRRRGSWPAPIRLSLTPASASRFRVVVRWWSWGATTATGTTGFKTRANTSARNTAHDEDPTRRTRAASQPQRRRRQPPPHRARSRALCDVVKITTTTIVGGQSWSPGSLDPPKVILNIADHLRRTVLDIARSATPDTTRHALNAPSARPSARAPRDRPCYCRPRARYAGVTFLPHRSCVGRP